MLEKKSGYYLGNKKALLELSNSAFLMYIFLVGLILLLQ